MNKQRMMREQETFKGHTLEEALAALADAGFKDVTCEFDYDVMNPLAKARGLPMGML